MADPRQKSVSDIAVALQALLPRGPVWPRQPGAALTRVTSGIAATVHRVHARALALLVDAFPATTYELLPEWEETLGLPTRCAPNITFSRASRASALSANGDLLVVAHDILRYSHGPDGAGRAVLVEGEATNLLRNPLALGAVVGGAMPTYWARIQSGVTVAVVGTGAERGIRYLDIRVAGSGLAATAIRVPFETASAVPAATGDRFALSWFHRVVSAAKGAITSSQAVLEEMAGGTLVRTVTQTVSTPDALPLSAQRAERSFLIEGVGVTSLRPAGRWAFAPDTAGDLDVVLRIGLPQLEAGDAATTPIFPWSGGMGVTTRAADVYQAASLQQRRALVVARLASQGGQSAPYFVERARLLGYEVTIREYAPSRFNMRFGQPMNGPEWAHVWAIRAPETTVTPFRFGDTFGRRFRSWGTGVLECELAPLAPAHTILLFQYS